MRILLPAAAALVPLLIAPRFLFYFDVTPKIAPLLLAACAALAIAARDREFFKPVLAARAGRGLIAILGALAASATLSTALSAHPALSLNGGNWRRWGLLEQLAVLILAAAAAAHLRQRPEALRELLRAAALSGAIAASYGIAQYFGWDPLQPAAAYRAGEGIWTIVRPPGALGHADYFATYLLLALFLSAALAAIEKRAAWKLAAGAACAVCIPALILTGTRAGIVGLLAGAAALAWFSRPWRPRAAHLAFGMGLAIAAGAALAALYFSPAGAPLRARVRWSMDDPRGGARILLWRDSLRMAAHRPLTGYGPETFGTEFPHFQSVELARAYPDFRHESPHNLFLDALTAQGIPGLAAWLALTGLGFWAALRAARAQPLLAACLGAGLAAACAAQQFSSLTPANAFYLGLLLAALTSIAPSEDSQPWRFAVPRPAFAATALAVSIAMFALCVRLVAADVFLARVKADFDAGRPHAAAADYKRVLGWHPAGSSADIFYSRSMLLAAGHATKPLDKLAAIDESIAGAVRATQTAEEKQDAWYNLAVLYGSLNNAVGAEESLRAAIQCAPDWFKPHWTLARVLGAAGRLQEAETEAAMADRLDGKDPEVAGTLREIRASRKP